MHERPKSQASKPGQVRHCRVSDMLRIPRAEEGCLAKSVTVEQATISAGDMDIVLGLTARAHRDDHSTYSTEC